MDSFLQMLAELNSTGELKVSIWRSLGYTFNRSWICIVFFNSVLFSGFNEGARWETINEVYLSSILCLALSLGIAGIAYKTIMKLFDLKLGEFLGPLIAGFGLICLTLSFLSGVEPSALVLFISAIGTGFGSALVLLDVGRSYATATSKICSLEVLGATVLAALISLATYFLPIALALFVVFVVPFLSILCIRHSNNIKSSVVEHRSSKGERLSGKMLSKFILTAFILGAVTGFMRDLYSLHSNDAFGIEYTVAFSIAVLIAAALMIVIILVNKKFSIETLYKPVVLLCTIGFAVVPAFGIHTYMPFLIVTIGYTLFEILVWVILSQLANRFQYTSVQIFGVGRSIVLAVGVIAGALFARSFFGQETVSTQTLIIFSAIAISLLTFARSYVLTGHDLEIFEDGGTHIDDVPSPPAKIPLFKRCQIIGQYYGLSNREIEVFHLLSSGRNAARVQEELMISAGTVNTHTHHIYQKMDIHTQQELIDRMQNADINSIQRELEKRA